MESFEHMLTGGHHNSLGRTEEVVACIKAEPERLNELLDTYASEDEVVRLRVSSALKRITKAHPDWVLPHVDRVMTIVDNLHQASTQWTFAQIFLELRPLINEDQFRLVLEMLKRNLEQWEDWIVLNMTMKTLSIWAKTDGDLREWLIPQLEYRRNDPRKSVANTARKSLEALR